MSYFHKSNLRSSVTAQFPSFTVRRGDNVAQSEAEGDCEFVYNITASPNYRFCIASTSYRNDVDVAQGMTATHYMDYFFKINVRHIRLLLVIGLCLQNLSNCSS
jgi:hypothetical protein